MPPSKGESNAARRIRQREETLHEMTPELKKEYETLKNKIENHNRRDIIVAHEIGLIISELLANERKYGESAVPEIAKALGGALRLEDLWDLRAFANAFSKAKIQELAKTRTAGGNLLSFDHLRLIARQRGSERDRWLKYVVEHGLTAAELGAAISEKYAQKTQTKSPTIKPPRGILGGLKQIRVYFDAITKRIGIWDRHVFSAIQKSSSDTCTDDLLQQLDETLETQRAAINNAEHIIGRVEQAKERVQHIIGLKKTGHHGPANHEDVGPPDTPRHAQPAPQGGHPRKGVKKKKVNPGGKSAKKSKLPAKSAAPIKKKKMAKKIPSNDVSLPDPA
jgi:hypothetical protein